MNGNWLKTLVALAAFLIAGSAAYFSVTGLGVLFSGAAVAVMVMAGSLEFAKLVTATYLKQKWDTIQGFNKWYLATAVTILMLITSAGIFGYLSNAFQQQNLQLQQVDRQILIHSTKIEQNESQIKQLSTQITESNNNQGKILDNGKVNSRLLRSVDNRDKQISKLNDRIAKLQEENAAENDSINKIKTDNISIEKEVGGFRFVAEAFGVELNTVVKFFIILIVIVFDPLAIALVIAFNQLVMVKKKDEEEENVTPQSPEQLQDFVDETSRLHLSEDDLKKLEEVLLNPPPPNEELKKAADEYKRRGELLAEIIKNDEELGLYDEPFDNSMIKEDLDDEVSDWDETLMDGLEDEDNDWGDLDMNDLIGDDEIFSTTEPNNEIFSTITPNEENIFQKEEDWTEEMEQQYWEAQEPDILPVSEEVEEEVIPFDVAVDNEPELEFSDEFITQAIEEFNREQLEEEFDLPQPTVDVTQINNTLEEVNKELDNTSPEQDDEKKNYNQ